MNITPEFLFILLSVWFAIGILFGWGCKERYPGNTTDEWARGYNAGRRSVKRKDYKYGYEEGYKDGKKEILQKIDKMKVGD